MTLPAYCRSQKGHLKVLQIATGQIKPEDYPGADLVDYNVYAGIPRWWRRLEELLRLDLYLALRAKAIAQGYDIIIAHSEKVGIPLSFVGLSKPLVVMVHHMESPMKAWFVRTTGITKKWAGIGYVSKESKWFLMSYYGVPAERLFECESAKHLDRAMTEYIAYDGPIMSVGVAKRDYSTMLKALADLPGFETELYVSSKFGDRLARGIDKVPEWVRCMGYVPDAELSRRYQHTRFVVVPLLDTTQNSAGVNAVLEASAYRKAVIATRAGGMPSFVRDGETGILVPPRNVQAMRDAIQRLWTQPHLAREMGLAGRRYVEANFDPKIISAGIIEVLARVHAQSSPKRGLG